MLYRAFHFFIESLHCGFFAGLAHALGVAIIHVLIRVSVSGFVEKGNHADSAPRLRAPILEVIIHAEPDEMRPVLGFCTLSTKFMSASTMSFGVAT